MGELDVEGEMTGIIEGIEASKNGSMFNIRNLEHCQAHQFILHLTTFDPDIVHFSGHGNTDSLAFLGEDGTQADMDKAEFAILIEAARKKSLRGLVFNACFSAYDVGKFTALGVNVIGMQRPVRDDAAKWFSWLFYDKLGDGQTFQGAFNGASRLVKHRMKEGFYPEFFSSDQNRPVRML
jgi:hypothetical protein